MLEFLSLVLAGSAAALLGFWAGWRAHAAKITIESVQELDSDDDRELSFDLPNSRPTASFVVKNPLTKAEAEELREKFMSAFGCNTHGAHPHTRGGSPRHCLHCATCNPPHGFEFGRTAEQHWTGAPATHLPNVERVDSERSRINPTDIDPRRPLTERHTNISGPYGGRREQGRVRTDEAKCPAMAAGAEHHGCQLSEGHSGPHHDVTQWEWD